MFIGKITENYCAENSYSSFENLKILMKVLLLRKYRTKIAFLFLSQQPDAGILVRQWFTIVTQR